MNRVFGGFIGTSIKLPNTSPLPLLPFAQADNLLIIHHESQIAKEAQ